LKLFVTGAILGWIIYTYGWSNITKIVLRAQYGWLFSGVVIFVVSVFLGAYQWQIILENKRIMLPFEKTLRLYFIGIFFNNFILGTVAGDAFKVAALHLDTKKGKASFAATFLDRLAGFLVLAVYAVVGGTIIFIINIQQDKQFYMVLAVVAFFVSVISGFFVTLLSQRLQNLFRKALIKLPGFPGKEVVRNVLEETFINRHGEEEKALLFKVGCISFAIQTLRIGVNIFAAQALGLFSFATLQYFFVITPIIALLVIIPMPFGVRETIGGMLFGLAGFSVDESVIMLFLATVVCVSGSLVGGFLFLFEERTKKNQETLQSSVS
jgi:hypothetical protein